MTYGEFERFIRDYFTQQVTHFPEDMRSQFTAQAELFMDILEKYHAEFITPLLRAKDTADKADYPRMY